MSALLLLFACLALGFCVARSGRAPQGLAPGLNWWIFTIALPALVMDSIPRLHFERDLWFPVFAMWLVFFGGWGVAALAGARLGWSRARTGAVALVASLGNTAFMGYPLIELLRGREGLTVGVIADQLGTFLALSTGGMAIAAYYSGQSLHPRAMFRRIATFPPFIGLLVGVTATLFGGWPEPIDYVLARLAATLAPLALVSIGLQFNLKLEASQIGAAAVALGWKLAIVPALIYVLGVSFGVDGLPLTIAVLQGAMGPMISAAILVEQNNLDSQLAYAALGVGVLVVMISVPLINALL